MRCLQKIWSIRVGCKTIAFLAASKVKSAGHTFLYSIASDAENQAATNLSPDFEGSCMDWLNSDIGDEGWASPCARPHADPAMSPARERTQGDAPTLDWTEMESAKP
ncbi:MAG: hypothetical protein JO031_04745 [Ktedonobacteraceae bacterium]|nr:hypothetical protein [Ktedonobacteraceae bacterium]